MPDSYSRKNFSRILVLHFEPNILEISISFIIVCVMLRLDLKIYSLKFTQILAKIKFLC
ncbi:MAG: hypothetical protein LBD88_03130 [Candidatus Peribacteria bacterium]|nr:hypothetical protein [Candidatus Peribacteria bacterium]